MRNNAKKILTLHVQSKILDVQQLQSLVVCIIRGILHGATVVVRSTSAAFYAVYIPKANGGLSLSRVEHIVKLGTLKKRNEN